MSANPVPAQLSQEDRLRHMQLIGMLAKALAPGMSDQAIAQRIAKLSDAQLVRIGERFAALAQEIARELGLLGR